jgi:hypothetical protein
VFGGGKAGNFGGMGVVYTPYSIFLVSIPTAFIVLSSFCNTLSYTLKKICKLREEDHTINVSGEARHVSTVSPLLHFTQHAALFKIAMKVILSPLEDPGLKSLGRGPIGEASGSF